MVWVIGGVEVVKGAGVNVLRAPWKGSHRMTPPFEEETAEGRGRNTNDVTS